MAVRMADYQSEIKSPLWSSHMATHESPAAIAEHDPYPDAQSLTSINVFARGGSIT
jgi:hypothetical protein